MNTLQLVRPTGLVKSLDSSVDIHEILWAKHYSVEDYLRRVYKENTPKFKRHVNKHGIVMPVEVGVSRHKQKQFYLGNGHHRLAMAWLDKHPWVPVFFRTVKGLEDFSNWRCAHPNTWNAELVNHEGRKYVDP